MFLAANTVNPSITQNKNSAFDGKYLTTLTLTQVLYNKINLFVCSNILLTKLNTYYVPSIF